jgi:anaerobic selenocysteine-containing dehydrogenase
MRILHSTAHYHPYTSASGGWGSAFSVMNILWREQALGGSLAALAKQNKPKGFACASCAWAKPGNPHVLEFCENGAKATAWELTSRRTSPEFFARHTVSELRTWRDYDLEQQGRLTHPLRYDPTSDRYIPTSWEEAFQQIGAQLRRMNPDSVVFYASGRASLEASFMYQLLARAYGTNSLPDSSNMCHESTSVGLQESIGVPVGTVTLADFEHTDCIFSSARTSAVTARACSIHCRKHADATCRSSPSTRCASAVWSVSSTRNRPAKCSAPSPPSSVPSTIR